MATLSVDGIELYYEVHGSGSDVIVFAHGKGGNHMSWWQQIPYFSKKYRCITFDHRSYGMSTNADDGRNQDAYVDDLTGLLDHLQVERFFFVGQSMGGRVGLDFAIKNPGRVRGLVLASTIAGVVDEELQAILTTDATAPKELLPRVLGKSFREENKNLTFMFSQIEALNHIGSDPFPLLIKGASRRDLSECIVPTLLIVGDEDSVAPPSAVKWFASVKPNSTYKEVTEAGHSIYFEKPELFNALVTEFIKAEE